MLYEELIPIYYSQLTNGCGEPLCKNYYCNNSTNPPHLQRSVANYDQMAVCLSSSLAHMCHSKKVALKKANPVQFAEYKKQMYSFNDQNPMPLEYDELLKILGEISCGQNVLANYDRIFDCFSRVSSLNKSWMKSSNSDRENTLAISPSLLSEVFSQIEKLNIPILNNVVISAMVSLIKNARRFLASQLRSNMKCAQDIRFLPFLFKCPLIFDPTYFKSLTFHSFRLATEYTVGDHRTMFQFYLGSCGLEYLRELVILCNTYLIMLLIANPSLKGVHLHTKTIIVCTLFMHIIFQINRHIAPNLPFDKFQNEILFDRFEEKLELSVTFSDPPLLITPFTLFCFPTSLKLKIIKVTNKKKRNQNFMNMVAQDFSLLFRPQREASLFIDVRRAHLLQDSFDQLESQSDRLGMPLIVRFSGEEGVDAGGLRKEWFKLVSEQVFRPDYGMFERTSTNFYWFSPHSTFYSDFKLVGMLTTLAFYNDVLLDVHLPVILFKKILGYSVGFADLRELDPVLFSSLKKLLDYEPVDENEIEDVFGLNYQIVVDNFGETKYIDLIEDGSKVFVDAKNRIDFVNRYVNYILNESIKNQFNAFMEGFNIVSKQTSLSEFLFPEELQSAICGTEQLNILDLRSKCKYVNGYTPTSKPIEHFWRAVSGFTEEQKRQFVAFLTGSVRAPFGGLANLEPPLTIEKHGGDDERLPSCSTCFNLLHLPPYASYEKLLTKLTKAIENTDGFFLV